MMQFSVLTKGATLFSGFGNIDTDPLFVGSGDYHLSDGSPCIDAGIDVGVYEDFEGSVRPQGCGFDMGTYENSSCWDCDGDHHPDDSCGGDDCDDMDAFTYYGAVEICDSLDNDCDGIIDNRDLDEDGYIDSACGGTDCDDSDPDIYSGAPEICDGKDSDCEGTTPGDEVDEDGDDWMVCAGDCDDQNPEINPRQPEILDNGIDDDCDGLVDGDDPLDPFIIHVPEYRPTIQEAIEDAFEGEIILVSPGTYVENIDFLGKAITLQSESGADVTVIDGGSCTSGDIDFCSVVTFTSGETEASILDGFTIRHGIGTYYEYQTIGGGIFCLGSSPIIRNCIITENTNGSIDWWFGSMTISNCTIVGNDRGISNPGPAGIIENCTISENDWSGLEFGNPRGMTISNCTITNNNGSGISFQGGQMFGPVTIEDCTISGNITTNEGGGVLLVNTDHNESIKLINCTITDNYSDRMGGGIYILHPAAEILHCTISGNTALRGGGIYCEGFLFGLLSIPTLRSSIVWGNSADLGEQICLIGSGGPFEMPTALSVAYSDVQGGEEGVYLGPLSTLYWLNGNIDADPLFQGPEDFHLSAGSSCIDKGRDAGVYFDIDGITRPYGAGFDIGASEVISDFTLVSSPSYSAGILELDFRVGMLEPATWGTYLVLTAPSVQIIPLWVVSLPAIDPPLALPLSFPFPSVGWLGILPTDLLLNECLNSEMNYTPTNRLS